MKYSELKTFLANLAKEIKEQKLECKEQQRQHGGSGYIKRYSPSWDFRHHHIAYCELRGRKRDEIERPADHNRPDEQYIQRIKDSIEATQPVEQTHEAVCASA